MSSRLASPPQVYDRASEDELENRAKSLSKLLRDLDVGHDRLSFSVEPHALDPLGDLKVRVQATYRMLEVARLLREPARQSLLSRVRESLDDLERVIATYFVK